MRARLRPEKKPPQLLALPRKDDVEAHFLRGADDQAQEGMWGTRIVELAVCELENTDTLNGRRYKLNAIFWRPDIGAKGQQTSRSETLVNELPPNPSFDDYCGAAYSQGRLAQRLAERVVARKLIGVI